MTRRFHPGFRAGLALAVLVCLLGILMLAAGCGKKKAANPTFPDPPETEVQNWFFGIWGSAANDVYIVGQPGLIMHFDGQNWEQQTSPTQAPLISVWGPNAGEVFICGHEGTVLRNTGGGWTTLGSETEERLFAVGSFDGEVFAAGANGTILKFTGGGFTNTGTVVARRVRTDQGWEIPEEDGTSNREDYGSFSTVTEFGIAGEEGVIFMKDPEVDWLRRVVTAGQQVVLSGVSDPADTPGNFVGTDGGLLFQLQEEDIGGVIWRNWAEVQGLASGGEAGDPITALWSDVGDTLYFTTREGDIYQRNPAGEVSEEPLYEGPYMLYSIWGTAPNDIWAVGINSHVVHFDGNEWAEVDVGLAKAAPGGPVLDKFGRVVP